MKPKIYSSKKDLFLETRVGNYVVITEMLPNSAVEEDNTVKGFRDSFVYSTKCEKILPSGEMVPGDVCVYADLAFSKHFIEAIHMHEETCKRLPYYSDFNKAFNPRQE